MRDCPYVDLEEDVLVYNLGRLIGKFVGCKEVDFETFCLIFMGLIIIVYF
jgi:hypothetical protein